MAPSTLTIRCVHGRIPSCTTVWHMTSLKPILLPHQKTDIQGIGTRRPGRAVFMGPTESAAQERCRYSNQYQGGQTCAARLNTRFSLCTLCPRGASRSLTLAQCQIRLSSSIERYRSPAIHTTQCYSNFLIRPAPSIYPCRISPVSRANSIQQIRIWRANCPCIFARKG